MTFDPNGNLENGANELEFGVSENGELLALLDPNLRPIDQVLTFDQTTDVSQGRVPDGASTIEFLAVGTPGNANPTFVTSESSILDFGDTWRYDESGNDLGTTWRNAQFDDSSWATGAGPLGVAAGELPIPIQTPLDPPSQRSVVTHYFRREFQVDAELLASNKTTFQLSQLVDDGAIVYINGVEVLRQGLPDGEITASTTANVGIGIPEIEGPFAIPREAFQPGSNQIAVEVHQVSRRNSDVAFGLQIIASSTSTTEFYERAIAIQNGLRISEIMYHPADDELAEFIELTNISDEPLDLSRVSLAGRIETTIGRQFLAAGEHAVLVHDITAFRDVYGNDVRILGVYDGLLPNGRGEVILQLPQPLHGPFDGAVLRFAYDDDWYPSTDGLGKFARDSRRGGAATTLASTRWLEGQQNDRRYSRSKRSSPRRFQRRSDRYENGRRSVICRHRGRGHGPAVRPERKCRHRSRRSGCHDRRHTPDQSRRYEPRWQRGLCRLSDFIVPFRQQ